jgi:hypothetical protein
MPARGHLLFVVNVETRGLTAHVLVNGITVYLNAGTQASFGAKINPLVFSPNNTISVVLGLAPSADGPPRFRLTVQRGVQGADPGPNGELLQFSWAGESPLGPGETFRGTFEAREISWRPRWVSLPRVEASAGELRRFVEDFVHSLQTRDVERLVGLHMLKFREAESSLGFDAEQMASSFRQQLQRLMDDPTWRVLPVEAGQLLYTPEAEGRMVRISQQSGEPPVMTQSAARVVPFAMTVSRVDGQLEIFQ